MLYNFKDSPSDLFERMRLNVQLNEELNIRIWSFPMRFQPTDLPNRSHIGDKWSRYQLRSMQLILQATHGVVSGQPSFFRHAFGDTYQEFEKILLMPHHFIFNRQWFEEGDGKPELEEFKAEFSRLGNSDRDELLSLVSSTDARNFELLPTIAESSAVRRILQFYVPMDKNQEALIWNAPRPAAAVPDEERVEDAGLNDDAERASTLAASDYVEITA